MADCTQLNITDLPEDIIRQLLTNINMSAIDAVKLTNTCRQFRTMIKEDESFWHHKFFQSWPSLIGVCEFEWSGRDIDMKREIMKRTKCRKKLLRYFLELNEKFWDNEEIPSSSLQKFDPMFHDEIGMSMKFYYLLDDLISILKDWNLRKECNLTHLYYARKFFLHMKQCCLEYEWLKFINLPAEQQVLERALFIAFQWCLNQNVSVSMLLAQLKPIVDQTLRLLEEASLFSIADAQLDLWRHNTIDQNQWDSEKTKKMLRVIHRVLYDKFRQIGNLFGKLQFAVTFHAIARTFGIRCDILIVDRHSFLSWRESYDINNRDQYRNNYVLNIFSEVFTMTRDDNITVNNVQYSLERLATHNLTPTELMNTCRDFMWYSLERQRNMTPQDFHEIIDPQNMDEVFDTYESFMLRDMDIVELAFVLKVPVDNVQVHHASTSDIFAGTLCKKMKTKFQFSHKVYHRDRSIRYAIGMIVRVKDSNSLGVICWWEREMHGRRTSPYRMAGASKDCVDKDVAVYYKILTHTGNPRKVNQDELMALETDMQEANTRRILDNNMIGRYFSHFNHTHFTPTPVLEKMFPDDANFREQWLTDNLRNQ